MPKFNIGSRVKKILSTTDDEFSPVGHLYKVVGYNGRHIIVKGQGSLHGDPWNDDENAFTLFMGVIKTYSVAEASGNIIASYAYKKKATDFAKAYGGTCYVVKTTELYQKEVIT